MFLASAAKPEIRNIITIRLRSKSYATVSLYEHIYFGTVFARMWFFATIFVTIRLECNIVMVMSMINFFKVFVLHRDT